MSQRKSYARLAITLALAMLLMLGVARAAGERIPRSAVTAGGGAAEAGALRLRASVGQPVAGTSGGAHRLCAGLICGAGAPDTPDPAPPDDSMLFLPLLTR
jgi:hypothetical protein